MDGKLQTVRFCKVISVYDEADAGRIKVRLAPEDNSKSLEELDYAFPLLPKMVHVRPKVGEAVLVLLSNSNDGNSQRYYIGPVISQEDAIYKDSFFAGADSFMRGAFKKFREALSMNPRAEGIVPNDNDVVIRGRKNADIQITDDDVRIKAGVKLVNNDDAFDMEFNIKNPAYAKFKYHNDCLSNNTYSTATIVADKIALLSNNSPNTYNLTDRKDLITDGELNKVIESAYRLPYGEKLIEFLQVFVEAFANHTHPFSMKKPVSTWVSSLNAKKSELLDKGLMLSDTIRIN